MPGQTGQTHSKPFPALLWSSLPLFSRFPEVACPQRSHASLRPHSSVPGLTGGSWGWRGWGRAGSMYSAAPAPNTHMHIHTHTSFARQLPKLLTFLLAFLSHWSISFLHAPDTYLLFHNKELFVKTTCFIACECLAVTLWHACPPWSRGLYRMSTADGLPRTSFQTQKWSKVVRTLGF